MRPVKVILQFTLCLLLLSTGIAVAETHQEMVQRYIEISGIKNMLTSFPEQMDAMAAQARLTSRDPEVEKQVFEMMKESFNIERFEEELATYLLQNTDRQLLHKLLRWLESPLAKKVTREEVRSSSPSEQTNMVRYIIDMKELPPTEERIELIRRLEETTRMSDLMTKIFMEIMKGMMESVNLALPEMKRESLDRIYTEIGKMQPAMKDAFRQQIILSSFYTYRNISSRELTRYIHFYATETGQEEIRITGNALGYILKQWFSEVSRNLVLLHKGKSQGFEI
ncbi:MAG: hypothetical protein JXK94_12180 [Deltaproteobacteria bacterium]|nr:hypothetical protein [Deltaproteobacteria bacterium]